MSRRFWPCQAGGQAATARSLMAAAFAAAGGAEGEGCSREAFCDDLAFFLQSMEESEAAFNASVQETVEKGSDEAFADVRAAAEGRTDARKRIAALLAMAQAL